MKIQLNLESKNQKKRISYSKNDVIKKKLNSLKYNLKLNTKLLHLMNNLQINKITIQNKYIFLKMNSILLNYKSLYLNNNQKHPKNLFIFHNHLLNKILNH